MTIDNFENVIYDLQGRKVTDTEGLIGLLPTSYQKTYCSPT